MIKQRLINCDFLNFGGFTDKLSNKAKLLYFYFLTNADDKGFVGNALSIADSLDKCEENYENTLFNYTYKDALSELVNRSLVYPFNDKYDNHIFLIRHWFMHNKFQKNLFTNHWKLLTNVDLINNEYILKNPLKGKEIKINENKLNETKNDLSSSLNEDKNDDKNWEKEYDNIMKELNDSLPKDN